MAGKLTTAESFKIYEDGKHRRYQLLFGVNGGAFAVAKLFTEANAITLLGNLTLSQLAIGMIIFTIVMTTDIYIFGWKMSKRHLEGAFEWQGQAVLLIIGFLICTGWFMVR